MKPCGGGWLIGQDREKAAMARAIDVAKFLIRLAAAEDEPELMSHLRLQKLLYYVQGWSLAQRCQPMFGEHIEAWAHGPVVPVVWHAFKSFGPDAIPPDNIGLADGALTDEEGEYIAGVWEVYKPHSALSLRAMTHNEPPWRDARSGYGPNAICSAEITVDAMRTYFNTLNATAS